MKQKLLKLKETISNARIIDESTLDTSKVLILSKVKVKNSKTKAVASYTLVAAKEANLAAGKISVESPIGKGLLGKKSWRHRRNQCSSRKGRV